MANTTNNTTPTGWWRFHLRAPAGTPALLREAYEAIAAVLHAIESKEPIDALAEEAAEACRQAEPLLLRAADAAHERAMDAVWAVADGAIPINMRPLVRAVRHQVHDLTAAGELSDVMIPEESQPRGGRPANPQKAEITVFVKAARDAGDSWPAVATKVFEQFGVKYTADGLRAFVRTTG